MVFKNIRTILAIIAIYAAQAFSSECLDACDAFITDTDFKIQFCGTDYQTHSTTYQAAVDNDYCYFNCNVGALYQGPCGCPNNCYSDIGRGMCSTSGEAPLCICEDSWTGVDCSMPGAKSTCSNHGTLVHSSSSEASLFEFLCVCDDGFTGNDCSSPVFPLGNTPWGDIYDLPSYSSKETYGDHHPIWNITVLATIHVDMDPEDYRQHMLPENVYNNNSYSRATFHFDNGVIRQTISNVGMKTKGAWSRVDLKKGWYIKMNEFVSGQKLVDIKKLGLKGGSDSNDAILKAMLYTDFSRAVGVPVQRASYAVMYINGVYEGLYFMHEDITEEFVQSRIEGDTGKGNMMKMCHKVHMLFLGYNQSYYESLYGHYPSGNLNT